MSFSNVLYHVQQNIAPQQPEDIARPVNNRLEEFRTRSCGKSPISEEEMKDMINIGKNLASRLTGAGPLQKEDAYKILDELNIPGEKAAVSLMWFLTSKTAEYDELYVSGSMRLAEGQKLRDFLLACGQKSGNPAYGRISTHFKENLGVKRGDIQADNPQWGLDLRNMGLPAGKHTLLFALQPDGSLFIKMEDSGCPPFWKSGFRTFARFTEWIRHACDYVKTRFIPAGNHDRLQTRKEHVPKNIQQAFENCIKKSSMPQKKELLEQGKEHGISRMDWILHFKGEWDTNAKDAVSTLLEERLQQAKMRGYQGEIKGQEVIFPSFAVMFRSLPPF